MHIFWGLGFWTGASSREDARLREIITGEVLDARPSVRWADIAGLAGAKQARPWRLHLRELRHRAC
jgi:hypothetical protein